MRTICRARYTISEINIAVSDFFLKTVFKTTKILSNISNFSKNNFSQFL